MYKQFSFVSFLLVSILLTSQTLAATPDGSGPWADYVVSTSQGLDKLGNAISPTRSDAQTTIGVAEDNDADGSFFSLGFGGNIVLGFENGFKNGVLVIESTHTDEYYPIETALVEVSADGTNWFTAGNVSQDSRVEFPEELACAQYVRITDTSNPTDYPDDVADGYDVDGVKAEGEASCVIETENPESDPTPTPTPNPSPESTVSNNNNGAQPTAPVCSVEKPKTANLGATRESTTTVALAWSPVENATDYVISYGTSSGEYEYGVPSTGQTTTFTVGGLDPDATYYFVVRAINDCMPGDASNEAVASPNRVLGVSAQNNDDVLGTTDGLANTGTFSLIALITGIISSLGLFTLGSKKLSENS